MFQWTSLSLSLSLLTFPHLQYNNDLLFLSRTYFILRFIYLLLHRPIQLFNIQIKTQIGPQNLIKYQFQWHIFQLIPYQFHKCVSTFWTLFYPLEIRVALWITRILYNYQQLYNMMYNMPQLILLTLVRITFCWLTIYLY